MSTVDKRGQCSLYIDLPPSDGTPAAGQTLVTRGVRGYGSAYLILSARRVRRRIAAPYVRFHLKCSRLDMRRAKQIHWTMRWYPRTHKQKKQYAMEFYAPAPRGSGGSVSTVDKQKGPSKTASAL